MFEEPWRTAEKKKEEFFLHMDVLARNKLHQFCADTWCSLEDLPGGIDWDGERERERERERESVCERERNIWCQRDLMMRYLKYFCTIRFLRIFSIITYN